MAAAGFTNALKQMENEMKESLVDLRVNLLIHVVILRQNAFKHWITSSELHSPDKNYWNFHHLPPSNEEAI